MPKVCDKILFLNFDPKQIKVNESALEEMVRMRQESVFSWQHPLKSFNGTGICLLNKRASNAHLEQFLSDNFCQSYSSLFCFTETNNDSPVKHIDEVLDDLKDIHKNTQHGLALLQGEQGKHHCLKHNKFISLALWKYCQLC